MWSIKERYVWYWLFVHSLYFCGHNANISCKSDLLCEITTLFSSTKGQYLMHWRIIAFDRTVKECMRIMYKDCYKTKLEELEKRKNMIWINWMDKVSKLQCTMEPDIKEALWINQSNHHMDLWDNSFYCCPRHNQNIDSLELDNDPSWVTKGYISNT